MATESGFFSSSYNRARAGVGTVQASVAGWNARLGSSYLGRSLQMGAAESFGWSYSGSMFGTKGTSQGFLGLREGLPEFRAARSGRPLTGRPQMGRVFSRARGMGRGVFSSTRMAVTHGARSAGLRGVGKLASKALPCVLGPAGTAYFAYTGYKEGGIWGAVKGVGESVAWSAGIRAVGGLINPFTLAVAGIAAIGLGVYAAGEKGQAHVKKLRELEMGGGAIMEQIGSLPAATMRQRSALALQNSHINGRMAIGNEALLLHTSFR